MPYNDLESLLRDIFTSVNSQNDVALPAEIWADYGSQIAPLAAEFPNEFTALRSDTSTPVAVEAARLLRKLRQRRQASDTGPKKQRELVGRLRVEVQRRQRPERNVNISALSPFQSYIANLAPQIQDFSQFQIDGWEEVYDTIEQRSSIVILAPTGSGKTEVFLLPIVDAISRSIGFQADQEPPRFVLLYPRVPLLRDQLSRVFSAVFYARQRDQLTRPFIIGFQFGGVRANAKDTLSDNSIFAPPDQNNNQTFQVVKECPICKEGRLIYDTQGNTPRGVSRLRCTRTASHWWHVSIARNDHMDCHPHLLVTTAETLDKIYLNPSNRYESYLRRITGIGFDEVHMYYGLYGVHIYNLIRRIEGLCGHQLTKIASSATVANPASFAARLFYGDENRQDDVTVHNAESTRYEDFLRPAGLEIVYFLQSPEPAEGDWDKTFSTLIQTEMVVGHALHSNDKRALTFMESLDGAGRLTKQLRDAEARGELWRFRMIPSQLQFEGKGCESSNPFNCQTIYHQGECWRGILGGFNCNSEVSGIRESPLEITQVSSQNKTDFRSGNTVIATSILEVGVDDERIKTTIHYLPPRTVFSFIQRRGRAGRGSADPIAYTIMVLGNKPSDQFYFFRRNRLLSGQFELPLNPNNSRIREMHDRLRDERSSMKIHIDALNHIPNGSWRWVWDKLTSCSFLRERYNELFLSMSDRTENEQKQATEKWIDAELIKFSQRLNLRLSLRILQQQLPDILTSAQNAIDLAEAHLNGTATNQEVRAAFQTLSSEIVSAIYSLGTDDDEDDDSQDYALKAQLELASKNVFPMWDAIRKSNSNTSLADAQRLHDFFRVLKKLFSDPKTLYSPPDMMKIVLQSSFYLHLGLSGATEGPCSSRMSFFVPDAYFQVVRPIVVEKRQILPGNILSLDHTEESLTLLSNALIPYFTAYRYFGERLSTLDTEFLDKAVVNGVTRLTLRLADAEGIQRGNTYEANKVGVRPLQSDEPGRGFVRMCASCHQLYDFQRVAPCHGNRPDIVKVMARPVVRRNYSSSTTGSRPITQTFDYMYEMEGQTTIYGSEVEYQVYFQRDGAFIPLGDPREFDAYYEDPLYYAVPTRGLRWRLSNIVSNICNSPELAARFAEQVTPFRPDKELTQEVVLHTAAHLLHKTISSISGVNEQELEYFCDQENLCVVVWERYEGGAGLTEVVRNALRTNPQEFFQEMLANVLCPIYIAETTELPDFDSKKEQLRQKWFLPSNSPFLDELIQEAQSECQAIASQQAQEQYTQDSCRAHDGCPVCVQITYCTERSKQQLSVSRLVGEAILEQMLVTCNRNEVEALMLQAGQQNIELPWVVQADGLNGVFNVLVL